METTKEHFLDHYLVLFTKELWQHLPEKATVTQMLHSSGVIINNLGTHLIAAIHQNMQNPN